LDPQSSPQIDAPDGPKYSLSKKVDLGGSKLTCYKKWHLGYQMVT